MNVISFSLRLGGPIPVILMASLADTQYSETWRHTSSLWASFMPGVRINATIVKSHVTAPISIFCWQAKDRATGKKITLYLPISKPIIIVLDRLLLYFFFSLLVHSCSYYWNSVIFYKYSCEGEGDRGEKNKKDTVIKEGIWENVFFEESESNFEQMGLKTLGEPFLRLTLETY